MQRNLDKIILFFVLLICFSGSNNLFYIRYPLLVLTVFLLVLRFTLSGKFIVKKQYISLYIYFAFLCFQMSYCLVIQRIIQYILLYFIIVIIVSTDFFDKKNLLFFEKICLATVWLQLLSVFLEYVSPNTWNIIGSKLLVAGNNVIKEVEGGYYSGLAGEKAEAAFILIIGIAYYFAVIMQTDRKIVKNILFMFLFLIGLFLSGKRMITGASILVIGCVFLYKFRYSGRIRKLSFLLLIAVIALIVVVVANENMSYVFVRIMNFFVESSDTGRGRLWRFALEMFVEKPILGWGYGSYNQYTMLQSFTYYGSNWSWEAHNSYLQILSENGIVGGILWGMAVFVPACGVIKNVLSVQKKQNFQKNPFVLCETILLVVWMLYAITGNVFFYLNQLLLFMLILVCAKTNMDVGGGNNGSKYEGE